ncbi:MAG TPA: hypothetical protein VMR98_05930, partial [Candidatus Polarisedimenticolaceae bacterium]|nr:hypothetical protein [Candidatus Polarisedimenticolaceae bacterium]
MVRLPTPGGDDGAWGDILNEFLGQEHNSDGSQKALPQSKITNLTNDLASKVVTSRTVNGQPLSADVTIAKGDVGLGNADNTSDANKPVSTAQQAALTAHDGNASAHPVLRTRLDAVEASTAGLPVMVAVKPEAHGALRDGKEVYDAAMNNGSAVLTSASGLFVPGDVGKAITVTTVGVIPNDSLSTTILSYQSATQVTLAAVANSTQTGRQAVWGTDDTAAIKAALNAAVAACQANKTYYCQVQFSSGIYIVAAPTTKGGATLGNAQIPLPAREPAAGNKITIVLKGLEDAAAWAHWNQQTGQKSGAVIRTMLVGQTPDGTWKSPSVFGTNTVDLPSTSIFSNIRVIVDGIAVVAPLNPSMIAMDLRGAAQADIPNFAALADGKPADLNFSATNDNGVGLYMPSQNNNDSTNIGV